MARSGASRIPRHLLMSRADHSKARETSRWAVEVEKREANLPGIDCDMRCRPGSPNPRIDAIQYTVSIDPEVCAPVSSVTLRLMVPEDYPSTLPMVFPVDIPIPYDDHNHTYRTEEGEIHLCMITKEEWTTDCTIAGLMALSAVWVHKYFVWLREGVWPGLGRPHCEDCGHLDCEC